MATIYEVSELAGVSLATVSRVLNNSDRVKETTRIKVQEAMTALDYRPNSMAQSLASNRTNSIGILVPELHGPFFGTMLSGIEAELRNAGKHAIITVGHSEQDKELDGIEFLISRNVDALILHVDAVSDEYLARLSQNGTPVVLINRRVPALGDNCISLDNQQGGYIATRAVLDQGHRQIAYISGPLWKNDAAERLLGHKQALAEAGLVFDPALMHEGDFQETGGKEAMRQLIASGQAFTAVVCANDEMAAAAMEVASESGLVIPDQVSIIGFDNINFCRYLHPKLSTIEYPINAMGQMAARWVLRHVYKNDELLIQNIFEPRLNNRASITPPAA
jgi:LacI family transcriptional regulator